MPKSHQPFKSRVQFLTCTETMQHVGRSARELIGCFLPSRGPRLRIKSKPSSQSQGALLILTPACLPSSSHLLLPPWIPCRPLDSQSFCARVHVTFPLGKKTCLKMKWTYTRHNAE